MASTFADNRLTVADLKVFVDVKGLNSGRLDHVPTDLVQQVAPALNEHAQRVASHPGVQAYYAQFAAKYAPCRAVADWVPTLASDRLRLRQLRKLTSNRWRLFC